MKSKSLKIGNKLFVWGNRTYIMGIINITPDSFSGDGIYKDYSKQKIISVALKQAEGFIESGVDIIDIGGESTRPGSQPIGADEEIKRVIPIINEIAKRFEIIISIDTYKAEVANAAIDTGAQMVNDVWSLKADPHLSKVVSKTGVPVILMHNRSKPKNAVIQERLGGRYIGVQYENLIVDIKNELLESVDIAHQAGIDDDKLILDPGIGFGKTVEQNLEIINKLDQIKALGYPILLGPSRKSFIGFTLDLPPDQRVEGTSAAVAIGIDRGADIVRIHDIKVISRIVKMTDAIVRE